MEIGILGLPQSGKSTLFEIMTGVRSREMHGETCVRGLATVPDARFDRLVEIFKPVKVSPAKVPFSDVNAVGEKAWDAVRQSLSGRRGAPPCRRRLHRRRRPRDPEPLPETGGRADPGRSDDRREPPGAAGEDGEEADDAPGRPPRPCPAAAQGAARSGQAPSGAPPDRRGAPRPPELLLLDDPAGAGRRQHPRGESGRRRRLQPGGGARRPGDRDLLRHRGGADGPPAGGAQGVPGIARRSRRPPSGGSSARPFRSSAGSPTSPSARTRSRPGSSPRGPRPRGRPG